MCQYVYVFSDYVNKDSSRQKGIVGKYLKATPSKMPNVPVTFLNGNTMYYKKNWIPFIHFPAQKEVSFFRSNFILKFKREYYINDIKDSKRENPINKHKNEIEC